jgi:hypothetical protein
MFLSGSVKHAEILKNVKYTIWHWAMQALTPKLTFRQIGQPLLWFKLNVQDQAMLLSLETAPDMRQGKFDDNEPLCETGEDAVGNDCQTKIRRLFVEGNKPASLHT